MKPKPRPTIHGRYADVARELLALAMVDQSGDGAALTLDALRLIVGRVRGNAPGYLPPMPKGPAS